jgi:hypothetical protein
LLDRTLRMNARQRINGLLADWTAFPIEINDRGVAVLGEYHGHLVCEHADGSRYKLATTVPQVNGILADVEDRGLLWLFCRNPKRGDRLARPIRATGLHDTLGAGAG